MDNSISTVDDTARWVAYHRALESARPDALFRDPFAARLAGPTGRAIADGAAPAAGGGDAWYLTARTVLIDRAVAAALADGCDTVLNLGAGLDARPYRLDLPADLEWIEVDLPANLEHKAAVLATETPRCRLRRVPLDLGGDGLAALLCELTDRRILALAEGLVMYLSPDEADALADTLLAGGVDRWCLDLSAAGVGTVVAERNRGILRRAPWRFLPADGVAHVERRGWTACDIEPLFPAAVALGRVDTPDAHRLAAEPQPDPRAPGDAPWSGVVTYTPTANPASAAGPR
ncbi:MULTISPECIES: class I SAM-dependent methyltransferase [Tsukamurella]|uniref:S-adenosyl-L-methionine-dependent methyltransferase n=2 Tax=Tsukamurella TaxID=2060 RepID=A0A5C5S442_9ACTN|nr:MULTISPECIES: SAM-dependent methyltransferase [Tsukamurella]NMD56932.1 class I SAM-dependent methyltransferase [Tsukamurella columbiensis]TWS29834.1 class I SAM-dependent methyltransferase [Tsukamurella conjunctivitidis]